MFAIFEAIWIMKFFQIGICEIKILRTCFCEYRHASSLCVSDRSGCVSCTDVDEEYWVIDKLGQCHCAVRGFCFYGRRSGPSVVDWIYSRLW